LDRLIEVLLYCMQKFNDHIEALKKAFDAEYTRPLEIQGTAAPAVFSAQS
jgi:hypothetical protein